MNEATDEQVAKAETELADTRFTTCWLDGRVRLAADW
jgi:hypothetical protein